MQILRRFRSNNSSPVIVVSGLPRSGTSLMMQMLVSGGLTPITDQQRPPDINNPKGYYEFERVKALEHGDTAWLADAPGKVVKVVSALLKYLPADYHYRIIFMQREIDEILRSQQAMLNQLEKPTQGFEDPEALRWQYEKHLHTVQAWLEDQRHLQTLFVPHRGLIQNPQYHAQAINTFIDGRLDSAAMCAVVDPQLYRQRQ